MNSSEVAVAIASCQMRVSVWAGINRTTLDPAAPDSAQRRTHRTRASP